MKKLFKGFIGFWFPVVFFASCLSNMIGKMYYNNYNWMDVSMFIAAVALTGMILKDIKKVDVPTTVEANDDDLTKYGSTVSKEKDNGKMGGMVDEVFPPTVYNNVLVYDENFVLDDHPFESGDMITLFNGENSYNIIVTDTSSGFVFFKPLTKGFVPDQYNLFTSGREIKPTELNMTDYENDLSNSVSRLVQKCYAASYSSGWHTDPNSGQLLDRNKAEMLCLIHSEISEAMEGERKGLMDDHLPNRPMAEVELADAVIRIADYCGRWKYDLGGAIVEKLAYNAQRADHKPENRVKEGGKKF